MSANGDPCKRVLGKLWTLVGAVRTAIAARPQLHCPLTKAAAGNLAEAVEKEFRTKRKWQANADGSINRHGQRHHRIRKGYSKTDFKVAKARRRRRDKEIDDLKAQLREENAAKGRGGQITAEWLARCALAAPHRAIAFADAQFQGHQGARHDGGELALPAAPSSRP